MGLRLLIRIPTIRKMIDPRAMVATKVHPRVFERVGSSPMANAVPPPGGCVVFVSCIRDIARPVAIGPERKVQAPDEPLKASRMETPTMAPIS